MAFMIKMLEFVLFYLKAGDTQYLLLVININNAMGIPTYF